jgi:hypothetical protein
VLAAKRVEKVKDFMIPDSCDPEGLTQHIIRSWCGCNCILVDVGRPFGQKFVVLDIVIDFFNGSSRGPLSTSFVTWVLCSCDTVSRCKARTVEKI